MAFRLTSAIRFGVTITNRVNPNHLAGIQRRFEFPRHCTTYTLTAKDSAEIQLKKLLEEVRIEKSFDAFQSLQILRTCVNSTSIKCMHEKIVESIWAELKKKSEINEEHYMQLMKYYEHIEKSDEILKLFDEILTLGLKIRAAGYIIVLHAHLDKKNTKKAWKFLFEMEEANYCMDEISLHTVLGYFLANKEYLLATKTIELLKERGFEMDLSALTKQWRCYARKGDIKSIENSLYFFIKYNIKLRVKDMVEIIYELSAHGYPEHINRILIHMNHVKGFAKRERETINRYIEGGQSHILPKLMYAFGLEVDQYESNLLSSMKYFEVPQHDYEQTKQNLQILSPLVRSENENKHVFRSEESQFHTLIRAKDCNGIDLLLERGNLKMSQQKYNAVIELYVENWKLEKAFKTFKKANAVQSSFKLNPNILFDLVRCMVMNEYDFEHIKELLAIHRKSKPLDRSNRLILFFQQLADNGQAEILNKLYDAFVENNIIKASAADSPLISVHLTNNNLNLAVDTYEKFVTNKNAAPHTVELMAFLIERNEMVLLQRVYKIYEGAVSTNLAQYRLAFAYLKCGQEEKAKSTLGNVNMMENKGFMFRECKSLEILGKVEETTALLRLTKGLSFDRHLIYRTLLELYCKSEQIEKTIELWTEHDTDETAKPNKDFVGRLLYYLKNKKAMLDKVSKLLLYKLEKKYRNMY